MRRLPREHGVNVITEWLPADSEWNVQPWSPDCGQWHWPQWRFDTLLGVRAWAQRHRLSLTVLR